MERFHTIRKHEASRRFGKQSHDCLNRHNSHCAATPTTSTLRSVGGINGRFARRSIAHESRVATRPQVKPNSRFECQYAKLQNHSAGNEMLAPPRVRYLPRGGPGGHCRYPGDQVPPRTSSRSRQKARRANHTPLRVVNLGVNHMAQASSGAATCPAASAPAARPGAAPGPPRMPWRPNGQRAIKVTDIP
jgi:hypothetical protein